MVINEFPELKYRGNVHQRVITRLASTKTLSFFSMARHVAKLIPGSLALEAHDNETDIRITQVSIKGEEVEFRYFLGQQWDARPPLVVIMLNPSTASIYKNDQTIHKIINRARRLKCGGFIVLNVGAARSTDPKDWAYLNDPIGDYNFLVIKSVLTQVCNRWRLKPTVLMGWGDNVKWIKKTHPGHVDKVEALAMKYGVCFNLGVTNSGNPRHPLYIESKSKMLLIERKPPYV
jgi:hypothetical protein